MDCLTVLPLTACQQLVISLSSSHPPREIHYMFRAFFASSAAPICWKVSILSIILIPVRNQTFFHLIGNVINYIYLVIFSNLWVFCSALIFLLAWLSVVFLFIIIYCPFNRCCFRFLSSWSLRFFVIRLPSNLL